MDILNYNYNTNSNIAIADPAPPNDILQVYSISYPMLAKSVSSAGIESPTGNSTNVLLFTRNGSELAVEIPEGFPSTSTLIKQINQEIIDVFSLVTIPLQLLPVGDSQARWVNNDTVDWIIKYPNQETKQLVRGDSTGLLQETIPFGSISDIFECDSRLGLSQLILKLTNGQSLTISSNGKWLDHLLFSYHNLPNVNFTANREVRMIAHFNSIRITKELICPRRDGIIISTN